MFDRELWFGSYHAQGANLAFANGHATFVRETIDAVTLSQLGTRIGGDVVPSDF